MIKNIYLFNNIIKIRSDDVGCGNHLDSARLVSLLNNTRALFFRDYKLSDLDCFGIALMLRSLKVNYKNQSFFASEVSFELFLAKLGGANIVFSYAVFDKRLNKLVADAFLEMVGFDIKKQKIARFPKKFVDFFHSFQEKSIL